jgi:hypothetical protein
MSRSGPLRRSLYFVLPLLLASCGAPAVRGVRVEAAEVVPDLPPPIGPTRRSPWVQVRISTEQDLGAYGRDNSATLGQKVSLCTRGEVDLRRQVGSSSTIGLDNARASQGEQSTGPDSHGRYTNFLYLALDTPARQFRGTSEAERLIDHDLRRQSDDLCFLFYGGANYIFPHRSETFTIPYPLIAAALARAGLPHAAVP